MPGLSEFPDYASLGDDPGPAVSAAIRVALSRYWADLDGSRTREADALERDRILLVQKDVEAAQDWVKNL